MNIAVVPVGEYNTNCYILSKESDSSCLLIDPGCEPDRIFRTLESSGLYPAAVLITHGHYDHVAALPDVVEKYRCPFYMHADDEISYMHQKEMITAWGGRMIKGFTFLEEKKYSLQGAEHLPFRVIHTPGHSPGAVCFDFGKILFSGDTLFYGTVGRTDIPGGDPKVLSGSLKKLAVEFPEGQVFPGHGPATDMESEFKRNIFLKRNANINP